MARATSSSAAAQAAPDSESIDLQTYVPALINILSTSLSTSASSSYRALIGLNVLEWRIVVLLNGRGPLSAQEVADGVCQNKGPVSRAIQTLEAKGLVRVVPAGRGRRNELTITAAGVAAYQASLPLAAERQRKLLAGFSAAEVATLRDFLSRMIASAPTLATGEDVAPEVAASR